MNNLSNYNEFKNYKKLNEMTTGPGTYGGRIGDKDTYFANVHGNLAGAENTLVGGALIRLFGFIKRKGMEAYISMRLKPELGRIYMNGILRYAIKNNFIGPRKKDFFIIKKMVSEEEEIEFKNRVSFSYNNKTGLSCIVVGADVKTEKPEPVLTDGVYICSANNMIFSVINNTITEINTNMSNIHNNDVDDKNVDNDVEEVQFAQVSEEELNIKRDEYEKKIIEGAIDIELDSTIKDDIESLEKTLEEISRNTMSSNNKLSEEHKTLLEEWLKLLDKDIKLLKDDGLNYIEEILKKKDGENKIGLEFERQSYLANINALISMRDDIMIFLNKYKNDDDVALEMIIRYYDNFLLEKSAIVKVTDKKIKANKPIVNRLGDELQELAKSGESVDLNDENFYKQFESGEVKKGVSAEILTDSPKLIKLQLAAEKIINGGVTVYDRDGNKLQTNNFKLENFWKKTIQDVLGMYSKFMIPSMVDPILLSTNKEPIDNYNKGRKLTELSEEQKLDNVIKAQSNMANKKFSNSVEIVKSISNNDYGIMRLKFTNEEDGELGTPYIVKRMKTPNDKIIIYRIIRKFDLDKVNPEYKEKDFTSLVYDKYNKKILPNSDSDFSTDYVDGKFRSLRGIYIIAHRQKNFSLGTSQNLVSVLYLFSKLDNISDSDWLKYSNDGDWVFKMKNFVTGKAEYLDQHFNNFKTDELKKNFKINMWVNENIYKIINIDLFGSFKVYDITKGFKAIDDYYVKNFKQE